MIPILRDLVVDIGKGYVAFLQFSVFYVVAVTLLLGPFVALYAWARS